MCGKVWPGQECSSLHLTPPHSTSLCFSIPPRFAPPHPNTQLCDFGHSCFLADVTRKEGRSDRFCGTPGYAAPEVANQPLNPTWSAAADVWGLGVVLNAMLSNMTLRWSEGVLDFSSRALMQACTGAIEQGGVG